LVLFRRTATELEEQLAAALRSGSTINTARTTMSLPPEQERPRPKTDETLTELGRGKAERVVLGNNPYGTIVRIVVFIVLFVAIFGSIFYFSQR
jgi:hypothetical protein